MSLRYNYNILFPMIASKIELTLFDNRKIIANVNFKLDTGADLTCIPSKLLGIFQRESEFSYSIQKSNNLSYIVNGHKAKNPLIVAKTRGVDTFVQPMKHYCFQVDNLSLLDSFGNIGLKLGSVKTPCTWKELYNETARGACGVYMRMNIQALRMIAINYQAEEEINRDENHGLALLARKNSKGTYDYYDANSGDFSTFYATKDKENAEDLARWMLIKPNSYKVTSIQKSAYKFGISHKNSELDEMILEYHK